MSKILIYSNLCNMYENKFDISKYILYNTKFLWNNFSLNLIKKIQIKLSIINIKNGLKSLLNINFYNVLNIFKLF